MTGLNAPLLILGLFVGMLLCLETGRWIGLLGIEQSRDGAGPGFGALAGALFGLLGLLVAFTFSGAATRFEMRAQLIVDEANAIGTAYLRIDLLPDAAQPALRQVFRRYVDARIEVYKKLPDIPAAKVEISRAAALQKEIWALAVAACRESCPPATVTLVLSSLNEMIDITTTRTVALQRHTPRIILALLAVVSLVCSFLAGFDGAGRKARSWVHSLGFAAILAVTFYVILDLEYPRAGLIRLTAIDHVLEEVRDNMK